MSASVTRRRSGTGDSDYYLGQRKERDAVACYTERISSRIRSFLLDLSAGNDLAVYYGKAAGKYYAALYVLSIGHTVICDVAIAGEYVALGSYTGVYRGDGNLSVRCRGGKSMNCVAYRAQLSECRTSGDKVEIKVGLRRIKLDRAEILNAVT